MCRTSVITVVMLFTDSDDDNSGIMVSVTSCSILLYINDIHFRSLLVMLECGSLHY